MAEMLRLLSIQNRPGIGLMVHDGCVDCAKTESVGDIYGCRSPNEGELAGIGGFRPVRAVLQTGRAVNVTWLWRKNFKMHMAGGNGNLL